MTDTATRPAASITMAERILAIVRVGAMVVLAILALIAAFTAYIYTSERTILVSNVMEVSQLGPWTNVIYALLTTAGFFAVVLFVVNQLRGLVASLAKGDPFVPENADRLRLMWIAIAGYEIARIALGALLAAIAALFGMDAGAVTAEAFQIKLTTWFFVFVIYVLAEVFRYGARLREDQKLTI